LKIPLKIDPCPINTAIAELRFESALPADAIFGVLYPSFKTDYPSHTRLPVADFPAILRANDPNLQFQPHYQLHSGKYVIQIGPKVFSIVRFGEYTGWSDFGPAILTTMRKFFGLGIANTITRLSIRYSNFYENVDIFDHLNDVSFQFGDIKLRSSEVMVRTVIEWEKFQHILLISNTAESQTQTGNVVTKKKGSVLDIDTMLLNYQGDLVKDYETLLESMHRAEKSLFFNLLKQEYVLTLNPQYK
jgi:uncharacterized protein (TIGR04255 family)